MYNITLRETMFPARLAEMRGLRGFLEIFCRDAEIERPPSLRLNLVLEELFSNTVTHGHGGDSAHPVWITLEAHQSAVTLTYLDQAPPFNPLAMTAAPVDADVERNRIGGLGVLLATELTAAAEYAYLYGRNRLRMVLLR